MKLQKTKIEIDLAEVLEDRIFEEVMGFWYEKFEILKENISNSIREKSEKIANKMARELIKKMEKKNGNL